MTKLRAASIGLGWWGGVLAEAAARTNDVEVVTCFARSTEAREAFAAKHGLAAAASLEDVLADDDVDALIIATPHGTHLEMVRLAAAAGKHIFIEKPITLTVAEGREVIAAVEEAGVTMVVGHHRRRSGANRRLRQLLDADALGVVHHVEAVMHVPKYQNPPEGWRMTPDESPAGAMTGLGVHMVDTFQYLLGPIARVSAMSKPILGRSALDDMTSVVFEFESGPLGTLNTSLVLPRVCDLSVHGHEQSAWSVEDGSRLLLQTKDEAKRREEPVERVDELVEQLDELARCARDGSRSETDGHAAVSAIAVLEAIVEAAATGRRVDVAR
jgi:predicted dehydrogenase